MGVHLRRAAGRRGGSVTQCMADKLRSAALSRLRRLEASSTNVLDASTVSHDASSTDESAASSPPTSTEAATRSAGPKVAAVPMVAVTRPVTLAGVWKGLRVATLVWLLPLTLAASASSTVVLGSATNSTTGRTYWRPGSAMPFRMRSRSFSILPPAL